MDHAPVGKGPGRDQRGEVGTTQCSGTGEIHQDAQWWVGGSPSPSL